MNTLSPERVSFSLGQVLMTSAAEAKLHPVDVVAALRRHARGDWGDFGAEDCQENERSLREGFRLLSAYKDQNGTRFYIITEADRSVTTILLPEDY